MNLCDISNNPNVTDTIGSDGVEELTFSVDRKINWFAVALIAGVLYYAFASDETKTKHENVIKGHVKRSRRALSAALDAY